MSELTYVPVKDPEHIAELANFAESIFREYFITIHDEETVDHLVKQMLSIGSLITAIADEGYEYYFANDTEGHVGFVGFKGFEDYLHLSKLYLKKDARGKGYGRQELEFVKQRARDFGLNRIRLNVAHQNQESVDIYLHMGFKIVDEVDRDAGEGFHFNDYIMECEF